VTLHKIGNSLKKKENLLPARMSKQKDSYQPKRVSFFENLPLVHSYGERGKKEKRKFSTKKGGLDKEYVFRNIPECFPFSSGLFYRGGERRRNDLPKKRIRIVSEEIGQKVSIVRCHFLMSQP